MGIEHKIQLFYCGSIEEWYVIHAMISAHNSSIEGEYFIVVINSSLVSNETIHHLNPLKTLKRSKIFSKHNGQKYSIMDSIVVLIIALDHGSIDM